MEVYNGNSGVSSLMASTDLRMEDLLQAQFENRVSLALFEGMAKFNLNLLLYQINKKYALSFLLQFSAFHNTRDSRFYV